MKTKNPRDLLEAVTTDRQLHANVRALQILVQEREVALIFRMKTTQSTPGGGDPYNISQNVGSVNAMVRAMGSEYADAKAVLELAINSEAFKNAAAEIDPLLNEIAALDAAEEKRRQEDARIKAELNEAIAAAKKTALAEVENHPGRIGPLN